MCFEDGGRGHNPLEAEKSTETDSPLGASERSQPSWPLDFTAQWNLTDIWLLTSTSKVLREPRSMLFQDTILWSFVIETTGNTHLLPTPPFLFLLRLGFPGGSDCKGSACSAGDLGSILGSGRFLKKGMATHSSNLAWRIPWTEEPGKLQLTGSERVRHDWTTNIITLHCAIALACQDFYFLVFLLPLEYKLTMAKIWVCFVHSSIQVPRPASRT